MNSNSNSHHLHFSKGGAAAQDGDEGGEGEEEDDTEDPDVLYEADVMQDQRLLDNDDVRVFGTKSAGLKGAKLKVVDPFAFAGGSDDGWQVQNADRLKKRLKRTIIQELSKKDVMPDERAKMVSWKQKNKKKTALFSLVSQNDTELYFNAVSMLHCGLLLKWFSCAYTYALTLSVPCAQIFFFQMKSIDLRQEKLFT